MGVDVEAFFHAATSTITYLVSEPRSKQAAIIDSVLDFDPASGRAETRSAEALADHIEKRALQVAYILETHVHADHLTAAQYLKERLGGRIGIGAEVPKVQKSFGAAMNAARVWKKRQAMIRACIGRHRHTDFYRLLKATGRADAAAKGQAAGDPWQLGADIVVSLSLGDRRAA